jgi:hypothetical protein
MMIMSMAAKWGPNFLSCMLNVNCILLVSVMRRCGPQCLFHTSILLKSTLITRMELISGLPCFLSRKVK